MYSQQKIGFMQGRLSPLVDGRIQAFPWNYWEEEFEQAQKINIHLMEWTLDQERLYENPLLTRNGQSQIRALCNEHKMSIPSLTGDCFMQAPLWKVNGAERIELERDFIEIAKACASVGITIIVLPLVDNGRFEDLKQEDALVHFLEKQSDFLSSNRLKVVFESDYAPQELARFIQRLNPSLFGVNYDIGNSAALGFSPKEEFEAYGNRVINVHIKDRMLGGTTVPLGAGSANFEAVFTALKIINYKGNFILQTARATDENHLDKLSDYRDMALDWLKRHGI
jgi:L-ribulose-5-phosphate 3-epimerase